MNKEVKQLLVELAAILNVYQPNLSTSIEIILEDESKESIIEAITLLKLEATKIERMFVTNIDLFEFDAIAEYAVVHQQMITVLEGLKQKVI